MELDKDDLLDLHGELDTLQERLLGLISEAEALVDCLPGDMSEQARRTWFAQLQIACNDDHEWLGRGDTLANTIDDLLDYIQVEEEE